MAFSASSSFPSDAPFAASAYSPPEWAEGVLRAVPRNGRLAIANLPTPIHKIFPSSRPNANGVGSSLLQRLRDLDITLLVKRDDMTAGVELGGNKVRKLEFLLADALAGGYDSVVTIGGEQSNHCRATAAACRMVGLEPHLILRTKRANDVHAGKEDFGCTGNILFDRMVGSKIYLCTPGEYGRAGSRALVERLARYISSESSESGSSKPYQIPVGGSNGLGTWGYINAVNEIMSQTKPSTDSGIALHHVVFACGSGGTATGITLGMALAHGACGSRTLQSVSTPKVHAIGVCDNPDYFYKTVAEIADEMGLTLPDFLQCDTTETFIRQHLTAHQGKGLGYASSTQEELDFVTNFALETGIALDPVYSGKALYHFMTHILEEDPEEYRGKNVLFWHTGGALGLYDKVQDLSDMMGGVSPVQRLDIYGKDSDGSMASI